MRSRIAAGTVVAIACAPALASGASSTGGLNAFRDSNAVPGVATQQAGLAAAAAACQGISIPGLPGARAAQTPPPIPIPLPIPQPKKKKIPRFRAALATAQRTALAGGVGKVVAKLKKGPALRTEGAAHGVAVAAMAAGSPRLALAGMLVANSKDPADRMNLVNAAAPLAILGKPAEAIALLDQVDKMKGPLPAVMGLPGASVLQNNRGFAYAKLKDHSASIAALRKALSAAPAMAEANTNLGAELICAGRGAEALPFLRKGLARNKLDYFPVAQGGAAALADQLPSVPLADQVAELSAGQDGTLPSLVTPATAGQWAAFHPRVAALSAANSAALGKAGDDRNAALEKAKKLPGSIATINRSSSLANLVNTSLDEPEIKALYDKALDGLKAADQITHDHWVVAVPAKSQECLHSGQNYDACFNPWCQQATATATGSFNAAFTAAETQMREYWRVAGRRETGLAANLSDQAWHDTAMGDINGHATAAFGMLISTMQTWVGPVKALEAACVPGQEPPPAEQDGGAPSVPSPGACPPALAPLTGVFKTPVEIPPGKGSEKSTKVDVTFKISCSKAEVELSQKVAGTGELLSVFGKGEKDFKRDTTTIVVGTKGGVPGLATGQSGFYVTAGKNGIEDFGWRVGAEGKADPFGGLSNVTTEVKAWGGTENISFVGAVDYIPTAFGFGGG